MKKTDIYLIAGLVLTFTSLFVGINTGSALVFFPLLAAFGCYFKSINIESFNHKKE